MIVLKRTTNAMLVAELNRPVQTLHHNLYPDLFIAYDLGAMTNYFEMTIHGASFHYIVAYDEENPVGFICFEEINQPEDAIKQKIQKVYVHQLSVNEAYQGKGIGKALMACAKDYAVNQKIQCIELEYWAKNEQAREFYRKQGFENIAGHVSRIKCRTTINIDKVGP